LPELDYIELFLTDEVVNIMVEETNRYAEQYIQSHTLKPRSRVRQWEPTNTDIYNI